MASPIPTMVMVERPWGKFERYTHNLSSTVKVITVKPGGALSLQYHRKRDELWVAIDPGAKLELANQVLKIEPGDTAFIPCRTAHRLFVTGDEPVRIIEISFGEFDEDDIVRLEDVYGRVTP